EAADNIPWAMEGPDASSSSSSARTGDSSCFCAGAFSPSVFGGDDEQAPTESNNHHRTQLRLKLIAPFHCRPIFFEERGVGRHPVELIGRPAEFAGLLHGQSGVFF